ncbi:MAG: tRNA pseudouridine(55) synthase TruB [Proteobacteria bacterium]|nr:tRNA pseudouridine(55) synthase TruB [Pseudomonadota bacterium]
MDGWLILNKSEGMTSTQAGSAVKRLFHQKKIGHAGTLDPFACGVLPLALGEATKTMPFLMNRPKSYKFTLSFGTQTATGDTEGEVIATSAHRPTMHDIESALSLFTGSIQQTPSIYSAIKIKGKPAYARARAGEDIDMPSRQVEIYELTLENYDGESATLNVHCGSGTYVRSLGRDLALRLGTVGHLGMLQRTCVGHFNIDCAISLENIKKISDNSLACVLLPIRSVLDDIPAVSVSLQKAVKIRHGQAVEMDEVNSLSISVLCDDKLIALGHVQDNMFYPNRVFNI